METPIFEEDEMANISDIAMGEYKRRMRNVTRSGLVQPMIPTTTNFELKGHILAELKDIPCYGKDHEDAYKHIDDVNGIADYFNIPTMPCDTVLLRMLPVKFKEAAKYWLKSLSPGSIMTWAKMCYVTPRIQKTHKGQKNLIIRKRLVELIG